MNKLKLIIIGIITGIVILIFFIISLLGPGKQTPNKTNIPSPTLIPFNSSELFITSIEPLDTSKTYLPGQPILISFTQEVQRKDLKFDIIPKTDVLVNFGTIPNTLIVSPLTVWQNGTTQITILPQTVSTTSHFLKNTQTYILKTAIPTLPEGSAEAY